MDTARPGGERKGSRGGLSSSRDAEATLLPANYAEVLEDLKARVRTAQLKAAVTVNRELIALYMEIGRRLAEQDTSRGTKVVERLARDLKAAFPEMAGFSRTNLFYMQQVYLAWAGAADPVQQLVGLLIPWGPPPRAGVQLYRAADAYTEERKRIEAEKRAREKARRNREAAIARKKHLDGLVGRESKLWADIDTLIATKQPKHYDQALQTLIDLRDLAVRNKGGDFQSRVEALRQAHARKPSFIDRLNKAGL